MPPKDPSQMTDEELDSNIDQHPFVEEEDNPEEGKDDGVDNAPDSEENNDEQEEDAEDEDNSDPGDDNLIEEEEEPKPPSRREQLRIRDLLERGKQKSPPSPAAAKAADRLDYAKELNADPEIIQQLEADRDAAVREASDFNTQQAESIRWDTRLRIDAQQVFKDHPELDKRSENFNPRVSDALNEFYLNHSGFDPETGLVSNPGTSYAEFTDAMYELAKEMAGEMVASSSDTRRSNRSKTGIRPGGGTAKKLNLNQAPEDMTDEELDAFIAQSVPRR